MKNTLMSLATLSIVVITLSGCSPAPIKKPPTPPPPNPTPVMPAFVPPPQTELSPPPPTDLTLPTLESEASSCPANLEEALKQVPSNNSALNELSKCPGIFHQAAQEEIKTEPEPPPVNAPSCPVNLEPALKQVSKELSGIKYSSVPDELRDCSGIFHRAVQKFNAEYCPNHDYPDAVNQRSTRRIAKWYHERGGLTQIRNPLEQSHLIKPGAIIFYARPGQKFNGEYDNLFDDRKGIYHMGIVVSVDYENGQAVNYHLFHGRNTGKPSGITKYHRRAPPPHRRSTYPPYGNGTEQWIAVAFLAEQ